MRVLVTGAGGFLGRAVVARALLQGWTVRALVRSEGVFGADVEAMRGDLAQMDLAPALAEVDAVIHTAAALTGDATTMERDTVRSTTRLAFAMSAGGTPARLVLAGSMAVYAAGEPGDLIDEQSPLDPALDRRDAYTRAKLAQEFAAAGVGAHWCARIGALWGPGRVWNGHLGPALGPLVVRVGAGEMPLCHVDRAAEALVAAAGIAPVRTEVLNLLDDDRPDAARYLAALRAGGWRRAVLPVSWRLFDALAGVAPSRAPGLLRRETLRARMMPRRYDASRAVRRLGLSPQPRFEVAMATALEAGR